MNKIKKTETDYPIHCPFCNELIKSAEEDGPYYYDYGKCEHLLFIAIDEGFEEVSERFCHHINIDFSKIGNPIDIDTGELNIDEFTDHVTIQDSIKYAIYENYGFNGAYFGFAP